MFSKIQFESSGNNIAGTLDASFSNSSALVALIIMKMQSVSTIMTIFFDGENNVPAVRMNKPSDANLEKLNSYFVMQMKKITNKIAIKIIRAIVPLRDSNIYSSHK